MKKAASRPFEGRTLRKGQACDSCRGRKLKCDAVRPVCSTCLRTYHYICRQLGPDLPRPPYPVCVFKGGLSPPPAPLPPVDDQRLDAQPQPQPQPSLPSSSNTSPSHLLPSPNATRFPAALPTPSTFLPSPSSRPSRQTPTDAFLPASQPQNPNLSLPEGSRQPRGLSPKPISNLSNAIPSGLESSSQDADLEDVETNGDFLLNLLWPGWPPYLPNPGQLEAIVEVFFDKVPLASELLNKGRFLTRLALPPRHRLFPHPALLHAICACTARFLPSLVLLPPDRLPSLSPPSQRDDFETSPRPRWDGMGPIPIDTTPGLDGDFGEIHHFWGSLYVEKAKHSPEMWLIAVQALVLLSNYCHQHSKWIIDWHHLAISGRLIVPLGLNGRNGHFNGVKSRLVPRDSILEPPVDDIDRIERQNLLWIVFASDTYHSTVGGWQGALDTYDLFLGLPTTPSTFPDGSNPRYPSQFADDEDLFDFTPMEHSTSFGLQIKGTLLLRKVSDFIRRADKREIEDPRATTQFRRLEQLVDLFRSSLPSSSSNPLYLASDGRLDGDLVMAHCLGPVSTITLHDRYLDALDASDHSSRRMLEAARALLSQIYLLMSTHHSFILLHPFITHAWGLGAKTLARHLKLAFRKGDKASEFTFASEIQIFRNALGRVAQHLPVGANQRLSLDHFIDPYQSSGSYSDPLCFPIAATVTSWSEGQASPPLGTASSACDALPESFPEPDWWMAP